MNILYIGPYRQKDDNGYLSRLYLKELINSEHNITSRPIYNSSDIINENTSWLDSSENKLYENYDCCIQHSFLDYASCSNRFPKNILIPILPSTTLINNINHINKINLFDQIIVNNTVEEAKIIRSGISAKIKQIDCPIDLDLAKSVDKKFGLASNDNNHKFYFIGNYKQDTDIIQKILLAFFLAFRGDIRNSLIMLLEGDAQDQQNLSSMSKEMKSKLKIIPYENPLNELYIFQTFSEYDNMTLHNTCDTFININHIIDTEKQKASFFGNTVIDITNVESVEVPYSGNKQKTYDTNDNTVSFLTNSLKEQLILSSKKEKHKDKKRDIYKKTLIGSL